VRDALIALGAGLLLAIALAFVVELLDDSIRTSEDLQRTIGPLPVLAMIPPMRVPRSGLVTAVAPRSTPAEAYRALRTAVQFVVMESGSCIEVASSRAEEGKSVTTANLAVALAQAGQRVIVVDADLRAPTLHDLFGVSNDRGLTSVIMGEPLSNALQRVPNVENLSVLTAGPIPANPSEVIAADRCREVVRGVRKEAAIVLIDTPPILAVTDAMVVAGFVVAVLLIARAGSSTRRQVRHALQLMRQLGAPVVGAVLNGAPEPRSAYYVRVTRRRAARRRLGRGAKGPDGPVPGALAPVPDAASSDRPPKTA
jgi:capsular exopolysaccharide synthesis family protein